MKAIIFLTFLLGSVSSYACNSHIQDCSDTMSVSVTRLNSLLHDEYLSQGYDSRTFDASKITDPRVDLNVLFAFNFSSTGKNSKNVEMRLTFYKDSSFSSNSISQKHKKTVVVREGKVITPISIQCLIQESNNEIGFILSCPQAFSVSFGEEGAYKGQAWSEVVNFSEVSTFSSKMKLMPKEK